MLTLVHPGSLTESLSLGEVLRAQHEDARAFIDAEIKARTESRAPLVDESTGRPIEPLGAFAADPALDGVRVVVRIVSEPQRAAWALAYSAAVKRYTEAADDAAKHASDEDAWRIMGEVVAAAVHRLDGVEGLGDGPTAIADACDAMRAAGLLAPLFRAVRYLQGLPRPKALRCGAPQRST